MSVVENLPRIKKLPDAVANQIAAGEVIERPASVVKELIENSIDAAATKIDIDIEQAGMSLIRVRDNGQGMHKDDLKLALEQHATSKLSNFSDLSQIASMGFRGEAIPSIASVSRFKMTSRLSGSKQAWSIDNGLADNKFTIKPAAHETGTTVEVNDLFFSTPGRRKFLKSEKTEYLHIQSLIRAIALSHFSTSFFVKHNEQSLFRLPAYKADLEQRVLNVCGRSFLDKSVRIDVEKEGIHLWGWLGTGDVARSQSDRQYFYVNGRIVRDKHVNHAIRLAYDDRIATGRFASYILHLQIDPSQVDVNVHPAKSEVRFSEVRDVHDLIYSSLLESLNKPVISVANDIVDKVVQESTDYEFNKDISSYQDVSFKQKDILRDRKQSVSYFSLFSGEFIISSIEEESVLIDVAKAKALVTKEYLLKHFYSNTITKRPIMVPLGIELSQDKLELVLKQMSIINQWGFELEQIAPTQISIRSLPSRLVFADAIALVKTLIDNLVESKLEIDIATRLASHVNDAGIDLNNESITQLINEIRLFEHALDKSDHLPWRTLDLKTLSSLLDK